MNNNGWITDRKPTENDTAAPYYCVFDRRGAVVYYATIMDGEPWKPVPKCEPYVQPKRYTFHNKEYARFKWLVWDHLRNDAVAKDIVTPEAAERIAAIYNEVLS